MKPVIKLIQLIILVIAFTAMFYSAFKIVKAEMLYKSALNHIEEGDASVALDRIEGAINNNPQEPNYYRLRARILLYTLLGQPNEVQTKIKELVLADLQTATKINPNNLVTARNLVPLYYFLAAKDISVAAAADNVDPIYVQDARNFYTDVKNKYPNDVGVYALVAKYEKRLFLDEDYKQSVARVKELRPDLLDWYDSFR